MALYFKNAKDIPMLTRIVTVISLYFLIINQSSALERHNSEFRELITKSIFETVKASGDKIGISAISKKADTEVIVYINGYDSFETVTCQKVEVLHLINKSNGKRHISQLKIGLCPNKYGIGDSTVNKIETIVGNEKIFHKADGSNKQELGIHISKEHMNDGTYKIYYPSIAAGHGIGIIKSYLFFPADNKYSLIVQYSPEDSQDINSPIFYTVKNNINGIAGRIIQGINDAQYK